MIAEKESASALRVLWDRAFDLNFWPTYPRKIAKKAARKAWSKLCPEHRDGFSARANSILDALDADVALWRAEGREPQLIPHPSTWLNREEFE